MVMRRSLSALVLGVSLMVASVAWAGFVLTRTALDPGRSEVLADQVLENEQLRAVLANRLADGLQQIAPEGVTLPRQVFVAAANVALEDPAVESMVRDGLVKVHQNALLGVDEDVILNATAVGTVARNRLVESNPELQGALPQAPAIRVELPSGGLSILGTIRERVEQVTFVAGIAAFIGAISALGLSKNRPAVLRRVAFWAFGTSLFWLALGFGVPFVASQLSPSSGAVISAVIEVFFSNMIQPAVVMAATGVGLVLLSGLWSAFARRRGALLLQPPSANHKPLILDNIADPLSPSPTPAATLPSRLPPQTSFAPDRTTVLPTAQRAVPRQQTVVRSPAPQSQPPPASSPTIHAKPDPEPAVTLSRSQPTLKPQMRPPLPQHHPAVSPASDQPASEPPKWVPGQGYVEAESEELTTELF